MVQVNSARCSARRPATDLPRHTASAALGGPCRLRNAVHRAIFADAATRRLFNQLRLHLIEDLPQVLRERPNPVAQASTCFERRGVRFAARAGLQVPGRFTFPPASIRLCLFANSMPTVLPIASKSLLLDGTRIHDITSFYDEINRVFMAEGDWTLGPSLDALDDMLYGGYGALDGDAPVTLVWSAFEKNRRDLGVETTRRFLQAKLAHPERFNVAHVQRQLDALEAGIGQTYFEIVLEILAAHPNITLVPR